ncbi:50S ribosomal protein L18 [Candidatus Falkowbacteria bacterium CG10_big_fil_rev_8_21_14_0_10_37_14]|uniref:Large ribosomal subunit protein uL18 n=1 Tax=Candidatus Falkowbacteria bacterium CG10_big_fil_rev_8_21_14_0_10_37_14 TaxID=1974561 RepID=A0A2M6WTV8_9BACT|nr:50S ribosomal protein L18 [Candidatus Falkowbacteria bacterium]PIT96232.1 MAG: 50S ribosomal protein L18 [Candidatus Falkowbacteria bacterium CG10_big_fil_rev_8_21_14_0_10_37_14]
MKNKEVIKQVKKERRAKRVRAKISGTSERPRLSVFRSNRNLFVQIVDDSSGRTLVSAHTAQLAGKLAKGDASLELGKELAKRALEKGIKSVVFDRGGNLYHGRIKAVADGARAGGLEF